MGKRKSASPAGTLSEFEFADAVIVEGEPEDTGFGERAVMPSDPEWHEWVMGQLQPDEMFDDKPTCDGLRRLCKRILGPIIRSYPSTISASPEYAAVQYHIHILWNINDGCKGQIVEFAAAADSNLDNNSAAPFKFYPLAIAETRAEGRALRKVLGLRKVMTAEEASPLHEQDSDAPGRITSTQIRAIQNLCARLKINVTKFINCGSGKYANIEDIPFDVAALMVQQLNKYQLSDKNPDRVDIPAEIRE